MKTIPPSPPGLAVEAMLETRFRDATPFYAEMLTVFVSTSWEPLAGMRAALHSGAWKDLGAGAHFVKGGALSVGAELATNEARALEEWARAAQADGASRETAGLAARLDVLERTLHDIERFAAQLTHWARERGTP
jgi:HPt (histidine-containing phosphotransfer) domain-containing protein